MVQYASRSLTDLEKWYSHIVSETLASDFGCNKFHLFLYGRPFKIVTDHKPLESVFNKPTPTVLDPDPKDRQPYDGLRFHSRKKGKENRHIRLHLTAPSTSTSTLFHKTIGYDRLARGPVKRKIN